MKKPNGRKKIGQRTKATGKVQRVGRTRAHTLGADVRIHPDRTLAHEPELPPLARLIEAFEKEKVPFLIAGMSAAILQGVPGATLDFDIWVGMPHIALLEQAVKLRANAPEIEEIGWANAQ